MTERRPKGEVTRATDPNRPRAAPRPKARLGVALAATSLAVFAAGGLAAAVAAGPGGSGERATRGLIAFICGDDLCVMNADGSGRRRLARGFKSDGDLWAPRGLVWSPDDRKIAFPRIDRNYSLDIYIVNADGSGLRRVTKHQDADGDVAWSRDGTKIAFVRERDIYADRTKTALRSDREIYVMNADGSGVRRLTWNRAR